VKAFLKKNGFHKSDSIHEWDNRDKGRSDYYAFRISEVIWLAYNLQSGFADLKKLLEVVCL